MSELEVNSAAKALKEEREVSRLGRTSPNPDLVSFDKEYLSEAEEATEEVLNCIHPTLDSEEERSDVTDHLRRLIKAHVNCDVFPYGSVPLKTYLPDGDIDLTVLRGPGTGESLPHDVFAVLRREEQNENSEYQVNDTQFIDAEVKLVKCMVQNIVVDISFNQLGGLSTLCFLEQVDRLVGRNHLFKRSIILIKTWCFYESRILGATHGLISTYALETLILYVFQLFHSTISGPLEALYVFLDYYGQFDWDNYCISLKGPVRKSSLPDIEVTKTDSGLYDPLLNEELIENCMGMFSVPFKSLEANQKAFQTKHLNIIDPLKENNNLGRSVNRGTFFRIRSAIKYGARKLGLVLSLPSDRVADGIKKFFANALSRHQKHSRSKVDHLDMELGDEASLAASSSSGVDSSIHDMLLESSSSDSDSTYRSGASCYLSNRDPGASFCGDVKSPSKAEGLAPKRFHKVDSGGSASLKGVLFSEDDLKSPAKTQRLKTRKLHKKKLVDNAFQKFGLRSWLEDAEINVSYPTSVLEMTRSDAKSIVLENPRDDSAKTDLSSIGVESKATDNLADLSGDYESHLRSFLCGQLTIGFSSSARVLSSPSSSAPRIQNKHQWDHVEHFVPHGQSHHSQVNSPAFPTGETMYSGADYVLPATGFCAEGRLSTRGTGTYFPSVVSGHYRNRPLQGGGRGKTPINRNQFHRHPNSNASHAASSSSRSRPHGQRRYDARCESPIVVGDADQSSSYLNSSCRIEFGSVGNLAEEVISASKVRGSSQCGHARNPRLNHNK